MNENKRSLGCVTRELLRNRPRHVTIDMIADASGVERHFISNFINGNIKHPSVHKVQALYEMIAGRKLEC